MTIEIEALDTLFFRDGKPFSMGDDAWANGTFPPLPSVLYGALRSAYMAQNNIPIDKIIEETKNLKIEQIFYKVKTSGQVEGINYISMPLDLVNEKEPEKHLSYEEKVEWKDDKKYEEQNNKMFDMYSNTLEDNQFSSHLATLLKEKVKLLTYSKDIQVENFEDGLLTVSSIIDYLNKNEENFKAKKITNSYHAEPKIGIARRNTTRTTQEGLLYRINMIRPENIKICITFKGLDKFNEKGLLRLGAENKIATYETIEPITVSTNGLEDKKEFKLYLSTPAIFKEGYYPTQLFEKLNIEVELITCAVGKYINVGGFDMQKRKPKEMQKAVPAGSVYYFRLKNTNDTLETIIKEIEGNGISEARSEEGFGIAYIGKI